MENVNFTIALFQQRIEQMIAESNMPAIIVELVLQDVLNKVKSETKKAIQQEQQKLSEQQGQSSQTVQ